MYIKVYYTNPVTHEKASTYVANYSSTRITFNEKYPCDIKSMETVRNVINKLNFPYSIEASLFDRVI